MVSITDFAMGVCDECSSTTSCSRVEVYDGPNKDSPLLKRFCTGSQREAIVSSGVQLFVRFESGFSPDRGFQADYAEISPTATTATTGGLRWVYLCHPRAISLRKCEGREKVLTSAGPITQNTPRSCGLNKLA